MRRGKTDGRSWLEFRALPWLLMVATLWIGAPAAGTDLPDETSWANIIVEFSGAMPPSQGDEAAHSEGQADIAVRILSRLEPHVRETARVFERLPLIALSADAETMLRLIAMPEVISVRPDRDIGVLPSPSTTGVSDPHGEIDVPTVSDTIAIPKVPTEAAGDELKAKPAKTEDEATPVAADEE